MTTPKIPAHRADVRIPKISESTKIVSAGVGKIGQETPEFVFKIMATQNEQADYETRRDQCHAFSARVWCGGPDSGPGPSKVSFIARGHLVLWVQTQVESDYDLGQVAVPP